MCCRNPCISCLRRLGCSLSEEGGEVMSIRSRFFSVSSELELRESVGVTSRSWD